MQDVEQGACLRALGEGERIGGPRFGERQRDPFPIGRKAIGEKPAPCFVSAGQVEAEVLDDRDRLVEGPPGIAGPPHGDREASDGGERTPPDVGKLHGACQLLAFTRPRHASFVVAAPELDLPELDQRLGAAAKRAGGFMKLEALLQDRGRGSCPPLLQVQTAERVQTLGGLALEPGRLADRQAQLQRLQRLGILPLKREQLAEMRVDLREQRRAANLLVQCEGSRQVADRLRVVALRLVDLCDVVECFRCSMRGAERLADGEALVLCREGCRVVALRLVQHRQRIHAVGNTEAIVQRLADLEGPERERPGLRVIAQDPGH